MSNGLEARVERLTEQLHPEPAELIAVILLQITPVPEDAVVRPGCYRVGKYGIATFMGGTEKERQREVKRLRRSGTYDTDPFAWTPPISGEDGERKAIRGGSDCD
jgi:hypothetical protein